MTFNQLQLIQPILDTLVKSGYNQPTEIQTKAIPFILDGKDVLGFAQTGTGKTAAFSLPIIQNIVSKPRKSGIKALILTPTRELAIQIEENISIYSSGLSIKQAVIFGGVNQNKQVNQLKQGVDILIATPGRLLDLIGQKLVDISSIEVLVLDEADRMLDMGFIHDIKRVVKIIPAKRQTLMFSATMPKSIEDLARGILHQPVLVSVAPVASTSRLIEQLVYHVEKSHKTSALISLIRQHTKDRSLIFTRTKHGADKLVKQLSKAGIMAAAIHGNKSQNARQRALSDFKNSNIQTLIATDIASRGIDIDELPLVFNYDIPNEAETYVHRIGRTGRAGNNGKAISLCDGSEMKDLKAIQNLTGVKLLEVELQ